MVHFVRGLERVLNAILIAITGFVVFAMIWGVFTRNVLQAAASWTEEISTLLMVWITLIGSVLLYIRRGHLDFDMLVNRTAPGTARAVRRLVALLVGAFGLILAYGGYQATQVTMGLQITSLPVPKGIFYAMVPVTGVLLTLLAVADALGLRKEGEPK